MAISNNNFILFFILFLILFNNKISAQSPISCSVIITSPPTCSTCCNGIVCVSLPTGGCPAPYTYSFSSTGLASPTPCENNFCFNSPYSVKVYDLCDTVTLNFTIPYITGINEISFLNTIRINPTLSEGVFTIEGISKSNLIEVYNIQGRKILEEYNVTLPYTINITNSPQGLYFVKIQSGQNILDKKIIKN